MAASPKLTRRVKVPNCLTPEEKARPVRAQLHEHWGDLAVRGRILRGYAPVLLSARGRRLPAPHAARPRIQLHGGRERRPGTRRTRGSRRAARAGPSSDEGDEGEPAGRGRLHERPPGAGGERRPL